LSAVDYHAVLMLR